MLSLLFQILQRIGACLIQKRPLLTCQLRNKKYHSYRGEVGNILPSLLERDLRAARQKPKLATDITEFKLLDQKLYLYLIIDLFNDVTNSYTLSRSPNFIQVVELLRRAFQKIPDHPYLILNSDKGRQYQMRLFQKLHKDKGIRQSMSRKDKSYDNSVIENFFGIFKTEFYHNRMYSPFQQFSSELSEYIECYDNRRIKVKLKD